MKKDIYCLTQGNLGYLLKEFSEVQQFRDFMVCLNFELRSLNAGEMTFSRFIVAIAIRAEKFKPEIDMEKFNNQFIGTLPVL